MSEAIAEAFRQVRLDPTKYVKRFQDAAEGVLGGLAVSPEQALEILLWTLLKEMPLDVDFLHLRQVLNRGVMQ